MEKDLLVIPEKLYPIQGKEFIKNHLKHIIARHEVWKAIKEMHKPKENKTGSWVGCF